MNKAKSLLGVGLKILFINHGISHRCGVYAQGLRHFNSLSKSKSFDFMYKEVGSLDDLRVICKKIKPDAILYNYMPIVLPWVSTEIQTIQAKHICLIHNVTQELVDTRSYQYDNIFDAYIALDTSLTVDEVNIFKTNRPAYEVDAVENPQVKPPFKIGTFGFPFIHKGFQEIAGLVNAELDDAIINLHMTDSHFCTNETDKILALCNDRITKKGIKLNYTSNYLSEIEMIEKLSLNDINILLYENIEGVGVSAAIDYLICAQKPILISESSQFRNYNHTLPVFPHKSLSHVLNNYEQEFQNVKRLYRNCLNCTTETEVIIKKILTGDHN